MSEADSIERAGDFPASVDSIQKDLLALGVMPGMVLLVHSSLSSLGWVCGGAQAVIIALEAALGIHGTLVMPSHSGDYSDPKEWRHPPVPESWWQFIRENMPAYEPALTPTRRVGAIAETFRKQPGVLRSVHPQDSFTARGPLAEFITNGHEYDFGLGENSPLAKIYSENGWVLLIGVRHDRNTSLHLAEHRASFPGKKVVQNGAPVLVDGARIWQMIDDIDINSDDFEQIGLDFEQHTHLVKNGKIGASESLLMPQRDLVDYAVKWMNINRHD